MEALVTYIFQKAEHGGPVHIGYVHPRPVPRRKEADRITGDAEVVGSGGDHFHWHLGGRVGGGDGKDGRVGQQRGGKPRRGDNIELINHRYRT